jgi:hypothetical protein
MNEILTALNNKLLIEGSFCDHEKAFNCENHDRPISKLETYGITGIDIELYQLYLKGRYKSVYYIKRPTITAF